MRRYAKRAGPSEKADQPAGGADQGKRPGAAAGAGAVRPGESCLFSTLHNGPLPCEDETEPQVKRRALLGSAAQMVEHHTPGAADPAPAPAFLPPERPFHPKSVASRALGSQGPQPFVATPLNRAPPSQHKQAAQRQPLQPVQHQDQIPYARTSSDHHGVDAPGDKHVPASNPKLASRRAGKSRNARFTHVHSSYLRQSARNITDRNRAPLVIEDRNDRRADGRT